MAHWVTHTRYCNEWVVPQKPHHTALHHATAPHHHIPIHIHVHIPPPSTHPSHSESELSYSVER